jgi:hypothetical protein
MLVESINPEKGSNETRSLDMCTLFLESFAADTPVPAVDILVREEPDDDEDEDDDREEEDEDNEDDDEGYSP